MITMKKISNIENPKNTLRSFVCLTMIDDNIYLLYSKHPMMNELNELRYNMINAGVGNENNDGLYGWWEI